MPPLCCYTSRLSQTRRRGRLAARPFLILAVLGLVAASRLHATDVESERQFGGFWSDDMAWIHMPMPPGPRVPNNTGVDRFLVTLEDVAVTHDIDVIISSLSIAGNARLDWIGTGGATLTIDGGPDEPEGAGVIANAGVMTLNESDRLSVFGNVTLTGGGELILGSNSGFTSAQILATLGGGRLLNANHTIRGEGVIGNFGPSQFALSNLGGVIAADVGGRTLTIDPGVDVTQDQGGVLRATNGGILRLAPGAYVNINGDIEAQAGSAVELSGANILAGNLKTAGTGVIELVPGANSVFDGVTLTPGSKVSVPGNTTLQLVGTVTNNGTIELGNTTIAGRIALRDTVTIEGSGSIKLSDTFLQSIFATGNGERKLIHGNGHTIEGAGTLSPVKTENAGTITANLESNTLRLSLADGVDGFENTGTLRAENEGALLISGSGTINNAGGTIEAADNSTVFLLGGVTISDGVMQASVVGGSFELTSTNRYRNLTHRGISNVRPSQVLEAEGFIQNMSGRIQLNDRSNLRLVDDLQLTGQGQVRLSGTAQITGSLGSNFMLTNVDNSIYGAGNLGGQQISVDNQGVIEANVADETLTLDPHLSGSFVNRASMQARDRGILRLGGGAFENVGDGAISAFEDSHVIIGLGSTTTLTQGEDARIQAGLNATVDVHGGGGFVPTTIRGGKLASNTFNGQVDFSSRVRVAGSEPRFEGVINEGYLLVDGGNAVAENLVNKGLIRVTNDRTLTIEQMLTLDAMEGGGNLEVRGEGGTLGSVLRIRDAVTIKGGESASGGITLSGVSPQGTPRAFIFGTDTDPIGLGDPVLTSEVTINGVGRIGAPSFQGNRLRVINNALIAADDPNGRLLLDPVAANTTDFDLVNQGELIATNAAVLQIENKVNNDGRIVAETGSTVILNDAIIDATRASGAGGTIVADDGEVILDETPVFFINPPTQILGGTLRTLGDGRIINPTTARLVGSAGPQNRPLVIEADFFGANGSTTRIIGELSFERDGFIALEPDDRLTQIVVDTNAALTGTGSVLLQNPTAGGLARVTGTGVASPAVINIGPNMAIEGQQGEIGRNGLIVASTGRITATQVPASLPASVAPQGSGGGGDPVSLDLVDTIVTNTGTLSAANGAKLRILNTLVTNTDGSTLGMFRADDGSVVELDQAGITGGIFETSGSGVIRNVSTTSLALPLENRGLFETAHGAVTTVVTSGPEGDMARVLTNRGTLRLAGENINRETRLTAAIFTRFDLTGGGEVVLSDAGRNVLSGFTNVDNTIRGSGTLSRFTNTTGGTIIADGFNQLSIETSSNEGKLVAAGSGGLAVRVDDFTNNGEIIVNGGSTFIAGTGRLTEVQSGRPGIIAPPGSPLEAEIVNNGTIRIAGTLINHGIYRGQGQLTGGDLVHRSRAIFDPTGTTGIGENLFIEEDILILAGGANDGGSGGGIASEPPRVLIDLGGVDPGSYDAIEVGGTASLAGVLEVSLESGFTPSVGDGFEILRAGSVVGAFRIEDLPDLGGFDWNVAYNPTSVVLEVAFLPADFDADGDVDGQDFLTWQTNFGTTMGAMSADGDTDGDGDVDGGDFLTWQSLFGRGGSGSGSAGLSGPAVPEPAAIVIAVVAVAASVCATYRSRVA